MLDFLALKGSLSLGLSATSALKKNVTNKDRLQWNDRRDGNDRPAILIPDGRLMKVHDAARWQSGFADAPALQFPAVIGRRSEQHRWRIDGAWRLPLQYSQSCVRRLLAQSLGLHQGATNDASTHLIITHPKNWHGRRFPHRLQCAVFRIWNPGRIFRKQKPENYGFRRHPGSAFLHFAQRQFVEPGDIHAIRKLLKGTMEFRSPVSFDRGISHHHGYIRRFRQQLQNVRQIGWKIEIQQHTGIVLSACRAGNATDISSKNQHGRLWKQLWP